MPSLLHPDAAPDFTMQDKAYHLIEYFFLSFLILRLMIYYKVKNKYMYAIALATLNGVMDELHQLFVLGNISHRRQHLILSGFSQLLYR